MNHFLHLLILLPALFTTIIALPTAFDDTSNSWTDSALDTSDTLLAGTFSGPSISSPQLTSPSTPAGTQTEKLTPVVTADQDWSKPLFLCCTNDRWWIDDEKHCDIRTRGWNDDNCAAGQGEARYCPKGYQTSVITDCYKYKAGV